tara:strand:+ start:795 stop:1358 length:564 start_codon:yes stop_codon:yes gene_type:complete
MKYDKTYLRKKFLLQRKKQYFKSIKFNFKAIFNLIKKHFKNRKIVIAGYYPLNYEVNILKFLQDASKNKFKIALPVVKPFNKMIFKSWIFQEPLYVGKFGILEPKSSQKEIMPDLILVPLVAFDKKLNRIGYGGGYYDRTLQKITKKKKIICLGVAYSFQQCNEIKVSKHDFKLDYIFTERGIISSN